MSEPRHEDRELTIQDLEQVSGGSPVASLKMLAELLSKVSTTRNEISLTFARNARG